MNEVELHEISLSISHSIPISSFPIALHMYEAERYRRFCPVSMPLGANGQRDDDSQDPHVRSSFDLQAGWQASSLQVSICWGLS
jgi:hypothetical protein